jgi:hypothetical protein
LPKPLVGNGGPETNDEYAHRPQTTVMIWAVDPSGTREKVLVWRLAEKGAFGLADIVQGIQKDWARRRPSPEVLALLHELWAVEIDDAKVAREAGVDCHAPG